MTETQQILSRLDVAEGSDHIFGAKSKYRILEAMRHYAEFLRQSSGEAKTMGWDGTANSLRVKAREIIDDHDLIEISFDLVAKGVGEG